MQFVPQIDYTNRMIGLHGSYENEGEESNNEGIIEIHLEDNENNGLSYLHNAVNYG